MVAKTSTTAADKTFSYHVDKGIHHWTLYGELSDYDDGGIALVVGCDDGNEVLRLKISGSGDIDLQEGSRDNMDALQSVFQDSLPCPNGQHEWETPEDLLGRVPPWQGLLAYCEQCHAEVLVNLKDDGDVTLEQYFLDMD